MKSLEQQTITLAAVCQVAYCVQQLSRQGTLNHDDFAMLLQSITIMSPDHTLQVYGDNCANLSQGLKTLIKHLGNDKNKDPEITRYVVSLLSLERRLSKQKNSMAELGSRIEQCQRQLAHYPIDSETITASFASIYSDIISPLGTPIQVSGNPEILKQVVNQHKIRALLLAGIRSSVLWRQVGGRRRNILFSRSKIVECAEQLIKTV